jgi:hypothetical protein
MKYKVNSLLARPIHTVELDEFLSLTWSRSYYSYRRFSDFFHITKSEYFYAYDGLFTWAMRLQVFGYSITLMLK